MIHNNFFKAKDDLATVRILTKEECLYNDVPLTENDFDQILDRNTWFDHHMLKLVYPFLENKQTTQKKILSTCKIKPIKARNLKWMYANVKIKTKH